MPELIDYTHMVIGQLAGLPTALVFQRDQLLFEETGHTDSEAEHKAFLRLRGNSGEVLTQNVSSELQPPLIQELPDGATWSQEIEFQPRAKLIPLPLVLYLEGGKNKFPGKAKYNGADSPSGGPHQVDPNRPSSMAPVMPNISLARSSDNAYSPTYDPKTMKTTPKYQPFVAISHMTYRLLRERGSVEVAEIIRDMPDEMKVVGPTTEIQDCVRDTLRDLRLYGLATSDSKRPISARYKWVDPQTVRIID